MLNIEIMPPMHSPSRCSLQKGKEITEDKRPCHETKIHVHPFGILGVKR
jgi:hypothetical protein